MQVPKLHQANFGIFIRGNTVFILIFITKLVLFLNARSVHLISSFTMTRSSAHFYFDIFLAPIIIVSVHDYLYSPGHLVVS